AQELQSAPTRLMEAIVAGYEVTMRVGNALNPASAYARGFHPTGVAGVFGATLSAGRLLGLSVDALTHALGIAGTLASGSLEYLADGAWTKRLNPGWAGHAGITAARLAAAGFNGPSSVFEGRLGVLHAYSDAPQPERLLADLGQPLQIMRVSIKPYACCRYNHGVLSGGAVLVAEPIEQKRRPASTVDAQFSAPYAAAVALVYRTGGISAYSADKLNDPRIHELMSRTTCYTDPRLDAAYPRQWPAAAEISLRDGRRLSTTIEFATGEPENPVSREALIDKFVSLAAESVA